MAVLQGPGQSLPSTCVCHPKDHMWNRFNRAAKNNWRPPQNSSDLHDELFCSRYDFSLENRTQFGSGSNYSLFIGENNATNCSVETVLTSVSLIRKCFGY